jgi:hypothetical protein
MDEEHQDEPEGAQVVKIPRSDAMLAALDRVVEVAETTDDNAVFAEAARAFWDVWFADFDARGLCHEWHPLVVLQLLEQALIADESLPVPDRINYAAAVATIRQLLTLAQHAQTRMN